VVRGFDGRLWSSIFNNMNGPVTNWEFITRSLENRMHSRIQFGGPLHG
jgi:hypothetical protein